jgi:hypothetical protein
MELGMVTDKMEGSVTSMRDMLNDIFAKTKWDFECYDKNGKLKWAELNRPNIVTHEGLDAMLNIMFHASTQITTWYIAPVETDTAAAATMTYAVPVYTEWDGYTEAARQAFVEAAASSQAITNSANKAVFTSNETKTLYGACLVGGGTAATTMADTAGGGTLFCYSKFSSSKDVEATDTFKVTVSITLTHA